MAGSAGKVLFTFGFALLTFSSQAIWITFAPVTTFVADELAVDVRLVGLFALTYPFFFLVLTVPSGLLLDRNFVLWVFAGSFLTFLAGVGRFLSFSWEWLFVCQLAGAFGQPFLLNAFVPLSSLLWTERKAQVISLLSLSMYLGIVFALYSGVRVYGMWGLSGLFVFPALFGSVGFLLMLVGAKLTRFPETKSKSEGVLTHLKHVVARKDLWLIATVLGLGVATFDNLVTWLQPALASRGLEKVAGDATALAIVSGIFGILLVPERVSRANSRALYLRFIIPVVALFFLILAFFLEKNLLLLFLAVSGFLMMPAYAVVMDWIAKFFKPKLQGSATGLVGLLSRAISVVLTALASLFIHDAKTYFLFLTSPVLLAFISALFLPDDRKTKNL